MLIKVLTAAAALIATGHTIFAQTPTGVGNFTIQRAFGLGGVSAPTAPNLPPPVAAGLQNGTLAVLQVFVYTSANRTLEQFAYIVPANSVLPIADLSSAPLADHYLVQVDSFTTTSVPVNSVGLVGHVTSNDMPTPFGNNTGSVVTLSFGYHGSGNSAQFTSVMESVSPIYNLYSDTGVGAFSSTPSIARCSLASLNGTYLWSASGWVQAVGPYVDTGRFTADGEGNITVLDNANINGALSVNRNFPATYTVNDDCSGQIKFNGGGMSIQISRDSKNVSLFFTSPSDVIANGNAVLQ